MARFLFGEFDGVKAYKGNFSSLKIQSEDTASILLKSERNNLLVNINLDYVSCIPRRKYVIIGEKGNVYWDLRSKSLTLESKIGIKSIDCGDDGFDVTKTYIAAMKEFLLCIENGEATSQNIIEGLKSTQLVLEIKEEAIE
jgi:predicted dehydrogenase